MHTFMHFLMLRNCAYLLPIVLVTEVYFAVVPHPKLSLVPGNILSESDTWRVQVTVTALASLESCRFAYGEILTNGVHCMCFESFN